MVKAGEGGAEGGGDAGKAVKEPEPEPEVKYVYEAPCGGALDDSCKPGNKD